MSSGAAIYRAPELYELAFSYRDFVRECQFLVDAFTRRHARAPSSFLELAAGPAGHAIEMRSRGMASTALDLAPEMVAHAQRRAAERGLDLDVVVADMSEFTLPARFELAACMLCSASYLLDDASFVAHLRCVATTLVSGGVYVLELAHPHDDAGDKTHDAWTVEHAAGRLDVEWIDRGSAQERVHDYAVKLEWRPIHGEAVAIEDASRQRVRDAEDLRRLFAEAGEFSTLELFGAFDSAVAPSDSAAWRLIAVAERD